MIQNILNLVGKDSLLGHLITVSRQLNLDFNLTNSEDGAQYISSLSERFEFGISMRPEVGFYYPTERESESYTFDNKGKFASILMDISQSNQPLCLFNHVGEYSWTYVFVLFNPSDIIALFQQAKPCDYFLSNTQGQFMLAANWRDFSYIQP